MTIPGIVSELTEHQKEILPVLSQSKAFLVADVTGLGKTLSVLAAYALNKHEYKTDHLLVLCPKCATISWKGNIEDHTTLSYQLFTSATYNKNWAENPEKLQDIDINYDISVVSYPAIRLYFTQYINKLFRTFKNITVVCDEFHTCANPNTINGKIVRYIRKFSAYFWGLTATPFGNRLETFYHLVEILQPGLLGSLRKFKQTYYIQRKRKLRFSKRYFYEVLGYKNLGLLYEKTKHLMFRRLLSNIVPKFYRVEISMEPEMEELYIKAATGILNEDGITKEYISRLADLQRVVNNVVNFNIMEDTKNPRRITQKEKKLIDIVQAIVDQGEAVIVYSYLKDTQDRLYSLLKNHIEGYNNIYRIKGSTTENRRKNVVTRFQDKDILLITDAGGESLNLQVSRTVIFYGLPFDIKTILQVIGRVIRLGSRWDEARIVFMEYKGTIDTYKIEMIYKNMNYFRVTMGGKLAFPKVKRLINIKTVKRMRRELLWKSNKKS